MPTTFRPDHTDQLLLLSPRPSRVAPCGASGPSRQRLGRWAGAERVLRALRGGRSQRPLRVRIPVHGDHAFHGKV